jgi:hypothetical protein
MLENNKLIFLPHEFIAIREYRGSRDSAVVIATGLPEGPEFESQWRQDLFPLHVVQTGSGTHPTSYPIGIVGCLPGSKEAVA